MDLKKSGYLCMHNRITLLHTWHQHNTVNHLCSNENDLLTRSLDGITEDREEAKQVKSRTWNHCPAIWRTLASSYLHPALLPSLINSSTAQVTLLALSLGALTFNALKPSLRCRCPDSQRWGQEITSWLLLLSWWERHMCHQVHRISKGQGEGLGCCKVWKNKQPWLNTSHLKNGAQIWSQV